MLSLKHELNLHDSTRKRAHEQWAFHCKMRLEGRIYPEKPITVFYAWGISRLYDDYLWRQVQPATFLRKNNSIKYTWKVLAWHPSPRLK